MTLYIAASDSSSKDRTFATSLCDGTADEVEINAALAADLRVVLLPGTYTVAGNVLLNRSGHRLVCNEGGAVVRLATGAGVCPIVVGKTPNPASSDIVTDCAVRGIEVDGNFSTPVTGTSTGSNSTTTLNDTGKSWTTNQWANYGAYITGGLGVGQYRKIASNTATQFTVTAAWTTTPDATSTYAISTQARLPSASTFEGVNGLSGIMVCAGHRTRVLDCHVHDCGGTGLDLQQSGQLIIQGNYVDNVGQSPVQGPRNGLTVYGFSPNNATYPDTSYHVVNNVFRRVVDVGIDLHGNGDDTITCTANSVADLSTGVPGPTPGTGRWGISVEMEASDKQDNGRTTIAGNIIRNVGHGIVVNVISSGTVPWKVAGVTIAGNQVCDLLGDGMQVDGSYITITGNTVYRYGLDTAKSSGVGIHIGAHGGITPASTFRSLTITGNTLVSGGVSAPVLATPTTSTSGGTLPAAGTYRYKVTALGQNGGESEVSNEVTATTGAGSTNRVDLAWTAMPNGVGYKIYRTAAGGATNTETLLTTVANNNLLTYTDTGSLTPAGAMPGTNTTGAAIQSGITVIPSGSDVYDGLIVDSNTCDGPGKFFNSSGSNNSGVNVGGTTQVTNVILRGNVARNHNIGLTCTSDRAQIVDNRAFNNVDHGINVNATPLIVQPFIARNVAMNNGQNTGGSAGIRVKATNPHLSQNICTDNQASKTQTYGVLFTLNGGSTGARLQGGDLSGNLTAALGVDNAAHGATVAYGGANVKAGELADVRNVVGVSPVGNVTLPTVLAATIPSTPVASTNYAIEFDANWMIAGGTGVAVSIGGQAVGTNAGAFYVPAGVVVNLGAFSGAPSTWKIVGA